ncbi:gastrula zinc finger protein xFG20-1-like [Macrobrachium nipponense]|uniref:gastrula zinc finger protein xFG20-1-like n=1 Tax=Macrobrachium nipponense TaxID=159736 RepID=UPI0030C8BDB7
MFINEYIGTTYITDLILGSQFLPALATIDSKDGEFKAQVGVLQCRRCASSFIQVKEALSHYRLHLFESHKQHFTVVVGGACPLPECPHAADKNPIIHFHCTYCSFTSTEIMDLPLHMEKRHLAFYREVSLVLRGDDIQRTKVYTCGECGKKIQGTVSTVQHLLDHDPDNTKINKCKPTTLVNGGEHKTEEQFLHNGVSKTEINNINRSVLQGSLKGLQNGTDEVRTEGGSNDKLKFIVDGKLFKINHMPENVQIPLVSIVSSGENTNTRQEMNTVSVAGLPNASLVTARQVNVRQDADTQPNVNNTNISAEVSHSEKHMSPVENGNDVESGNSDEKPSSSYNHVEEVVEINPLDLLTTVLEEDQKSENPVLPAEHFLLSLPNTSHFLENDGGGQDDSADGYQESQENDDEGSNDGSDIPSDILLDHPGVFQCNRCNEAFKYQYLLVSHKRQVHQGQNALFQCQVCNMEFSGLQELKRHMMTHSGASMYTCHLCGQGFSDRPSLKAHIVTHGGSAERSNKCETCNVEFVSKSELTRHIVKYQGTCNPNKSAEGVRCATCGEDLANLEALKEHRRTAHPTPDLNAGSGKKGFECDYCGKTFNCRSNLRDHLVVHTGEKPYPCDICGKSFSFIHNMKTHRLTHNEGRNEVCPYCDKAYKSKISLYYHMKKGNCRGLSTKEVPEGYHRCTDCLQMFASEDRFKCHKEKNICQVSHRCQHCGLRCSSETRLKNHLQKGLCIKKESPSSPTSTVLESGGQQGKNMKRSVKKLCVTDAITQKTVVVPSPAAIVENVYFPLWRILCTQRENLSQVLKQRRERIRMAIMEKRRRKEGLLSESKEIPELPEAPYEFQDGDDDSNSGSLTDLSTFSPRQNIYQQLLMLPMNNSNLAKRQENPESRFHLQVLRLQLSSVLCDCFKRDNLLQDTAA